VSGANVGLTPLQLHRELSYKKTRHYCKALIIWWCVQSL